MAVSKNEEYLTYLVNMDQSELLPGVLEMLHYLKENQPIALGSASKMQGHSGENENRHYFDAIVDGNDD
jgi:beta-phosphoglucomutase